MEMVEYYSFFLKAILSIKFVKLFKKLLVKNIYS